MTDSELLFEYCRHASQDAFREVVRRHLPLVFGTALRELGGSVHRAHDVAQTVFIDLARKAPALCGRRTLAGWLYLATHHAAAEVMRSEQRRERREQEASRMHALSHDPAPDWSQIAPQLDSAVRSLREADRDAILLRFHEGRSFAEIGEVLGLKEDTARHRLDRALGRLRSRLRSAGITSTTSALALALGQETAAFGVSLPPALSATAIASQAMAAAGTSSTSAIGAMILLMSTTKVALTVTGVALALLIVSTLRTVQSERRHAVALAQTTARVATAIARVLELEAHRTQVVPPGDRSMTSSPPARPFTPAPPQIQAYFRQSQYAFYNRDYARFYRQFHFTSDEVAAFDAAINPDPRLSFAQDEKGRWYPSYAQEGYAGQLAREEVFLGPNYSPFQEFLRHSVNYELAATVAAEALQAGSPVDPSQAAALAQTLIQADQGRTNRVGDTPDSYNWAEVRSRQRSALNPDQQTALTSVQLESEYRRRLADAMYASETMPPTDLWAPTAR